MRLFLFLIPIIFAYLDLKAQDFETILPQGKLPKDFTTISSMKYEEEIAFKNHSDTREIKKKKENFHLQSNYNIDDFLLSGKVVFNDPVTVYLKKVLWEILKNDLNTYNALRIYTIKSNIPNAFTTNNGIIFVSIGLLSKLENEAQLAFILAHEVIHFKNKHVINGYLKNSKVESGKEYQDMSADQKALIKSTFSQDAELEADTEGLALFKKSDYQIEYIDQVFDLMLMSDQIVLQEIFNLDYLEDQHFKIDQSLKLTEFDTVKLDANYDDTNNTHPNIERRKKNILSLTNTETVPKDKLYIVSENEFLKVKKIAQFELVRQLLLIHDFKNAFYLAYSLSKTHPESVFLQKCIMKSLYGNYINKTDENTIPIISFEVQKINYLFREAPNTLTGIIALRSALLLHKKHPDEESELYVKELIREMIDIFEDTDSLKFKSNEPSYKYEDAFAFFSDTGFFNGIVKEVRKEFKNEEDWKKLKKRQKKKIVKNYPVDQTLVLNPFYTKINKRKKDAIRYADSENVLLKMGKKITKAGDKLSMKIDVIDMNHLDSSSITLIQQNSILSEWFFNKLSSEKAMISPIHFEVQDISNYYGTDYITWIGTVHVREKDYHQFQNFLMTLIFPIITPITLSNAIFNSNTYVYYISLSYYVPKENISSVDIRSIKSQNSNSIQKSNIYYTLHKLKNRR